MAKQTISIGTTANDGTGDPLRTAFTKANENFTEIYSITDSSAAAREAKSAVTGLTVTSSGNSAYLIDQYSGNNPTVYVSGGETISFILNNITGHPFMIRASANGTNYNTGLTHVSTTGTVVTGANAQAQITGTLYWKVPFDLVGSTYVYQCQNHTMMVGNVVIQQPASFVASNTTVALTQANAAFNVANTANVNTLSAGVYANAAFNKANSVFDGSISIARLKDLAANNATYADFQTAVAALPNVAFAVGVTGF